MDLFNMDEGPLS